MFYICSEILKHFNSFKWYIFLQCYEEIYNSFEYKLFNTLENNSDLFIIVLDK